MAKKEKKKEEEEKGKEIQGTLSESRTAPSLFTRKELDKCLYRVSGSMGQRNEKIGVPKNSTPT